MNDSPKHGQKKQKKKKHDALKWIGLICFGLFLFVTGAFVSPIINKLFNTTLVFTTNPTNQQDKPSIPEQVEKTWQEADVLANQYAYMSYLLNVLAVVCTIGGLALAYFTYRQEKKIPDMITDKVTDETRKMQEQLTAELKELDQAIEQRLKAFAILSERFILHQHARQIPSSHEFELIKKVENIYPELWGLYFFKAVFLWYDSEQVDIDEAGWREKRYHKNLEAIRLMQEHLKQNPDHDRAYLFLISWNLQLIRYDISHYTEAIYYLKKLLQIHPTYCHDYQLLGMKEWYQASSDRYQERNGLLFAAEYQIYRSRHQNRDYFTEKDSTDLERRLADIRYRLKIDPDQFPPALDQRQTYKHKTLL
ncbi:hypothetical protein [Thermoflavimicrobium dichotomicum]|uniref:Tetratricopeptide repeat-containing protein n=1 Tax=Thermoflavimicrobium dichotomicum TaxID=46223 RepID=A0A1I3URZ7_9BACL|nr:hypothetical protein [Thermoflavimicrobium dichotomicum]SFJ85569.1 hypothetical protein SAMN05421852_12718 [Thermoflavimicrobium dichotomicum]